MRLFACANAPAEDLGEDTPGVGAAREQVAVIAVRREDVIVGGEARERRHAGRLLADVDVIVAAKIAGIVQRDETLLEMTDEEHPAAKVEQSLARQLGQHGM